MSFKGHALQQCWHLVDAKNQTVGRLATQIASILRGKHKPTFTPSHDMGDHVVVINADLIHLSGRKWEEKLYRWHTGFPGGLKQRKAIHMLERNPTQILRKAVLGMLKRTNLREGRMEPRLKIYAKADHPHSAQLPEYIPPLPQVPVKLNQKFGFGLQYYAHPQSYQANKDTVMKEK